MIVPTEVTVKLDNENMGHAQGIGIILCHFTNFTFVYSLGPVYYCPGQTYNTISPKSLTFYVGFQKVTFEPLEPCDFIDPQGRSWRSHY